MANYVGMKNILAQFWAKEKAANAELFGSKTVVDTLNGAVTTKGSVKYQIKNDAKDAVYTKHTVTKLENETVGGPYYGKGEDTEVIITLAEAITNAGGDVTALQAAVNLLNKTDGTVGSVKQTVITNAKDGTVTVGDTNTTVGEALNTIDSQIKAFKQFNYEIVDSIPTASEETMGKIYLVSKGDDKEGYKEYLVVKSGNTYRTEEIGDTDVSLAGYATETWVSTNAKDAAYSETQTIAEKIEEVEGSVTTLDGVTVKTVNGKTPTTNAVTLYGTDVTMSSSDTTTVKAAIETVDTKVDSLTAADIKYDETNTVQDVLENTGKIDDVKVKTGTGDAISVVTNKIATIDISGKQDSLSETQLAAVNSGITSTKVEQYDSLYTAHNGKTYIESSIVKSELTTDDTDPVNSKAVLAALTLSDTEFNEIFA